MKTSWIAGMTESEAKQMRGEYNGTKALRERLSEMLQKESVTKAKKGRSEELYSSPNWELHQADSHGYQRALEFVISLIE